MSSSLAAVESGRASRPYLAAFALVLACGAAHPAEPPLNGPVRERIAAAKLPPRAIVGVSVLDVRSGRVLCGIGEALRMTPASNVKLITTGVALLLLGDTFRFTTEIYARPERDETGVVPGDLVVVAGGDPALSGREHGGKTTAVFDSLAAQVARTGRVVAGDLVVDDTIFDRQYVHPTWPKDQLLRWYCAPVSALALNDNCVDVSVRPGARPGDPARVVLDPPTGYFAVRNRCVTVAAGRAKAVISRLPGADTLVISGRLTPKSRGAAAPVAVAHPTLFAATVLRERLARAGVRIQGRIVLAAKRVDRTGMKRVASASHTMLQAVRTANKRSQNFYAEMILKTVGRTVGEPSSFDRGVQAVAKALDAMGIRKGSYVMMDGSGLSRRNAFTPFQLAWFLRYMAQSRHAEAFIGSLPVSGVDGTLRRRLARPPCKGRILAKTGHLRRVSALSGYVKGDDGLLAFSVLVNGAPRAAADRLQDSIGRLLVRFARSPKQ